MLKIIKKKKRYVHTAIFIFLKGRGFRGGALFWLCWVFIAVRGLSLVVASGGYSIVGVHGLLTAVPSLVAENQF